MSDPDDLAGGCLFVGCFGVFLGIGLGIVAILFAVAYAIMY